ASPAAAGPPGPCAATAGGLRPAAPSVPWSCGWPARTPNGGTQDSRRAGRPGSEDSGVDGVGHSDEGGNRPRAAPNRVYLAAVPALPGRGDPGVRLLHG